MSWCTNGQGRVVRARGILIRHINDRETLWYRRFRGDRAASGGEVRGVLATPEWTAAVGAANAETGTHPCGRTAILRPGTYPRSPGVFRLPMFCVSRRGHEPATNDRHRPNSDDSVPTPPSCHPTVEQSGHHSSVVSKQRVSPEAEFAPATGFARVPPRRSLSLTRRPYPLPTPPARLHRHHRGDVHSRTSQKVLPIPCNDRRPKIIGQHRRHERHSATTIYGRNTPPTP